MPLSSAALARIDSVAQSLAGKFTQRTLADSVSVLSRIYTRERAQLGQLDKSSLLARAGFFFARDMIKPFGPLDELFLRGALPAGERWRVLDLGAGMGATSFGVARWLRTQASPVKQLTVLALEQNASALRGFGAFTQALNELEEFTPIALDARAEDLHSLRGERGFQLVLLGFVLNQLFVDAPDRIERRAQLVRDAFELLAPDGALIILEPASKESSRELMELRDRLRDLPIIAPCLHDAPCPMLPSARDWCHQELAYALPPALADVARAASLRWEGLSYASLVLAKRPPARRDGQWRVVSDRLESKGKLELYGCGSGRYQRFTQLNRKASPLNRAFSDAQRGDVLRIEGDAPRIEEDTPVERA
ncbi:MAG TPA: class I SAM-dependent methyltransferase [Polyangiales bacterium]